MEATYHLQFLRHVLRWRILQTEDYGQERTEVVHLLQLLKYTGKEIIIFRHHKQVHHCVESYRDDDFESDTYLSKKAHPPYRVLQQGVVSFCPHRKVGWRGWHAEVILEAVAPLDGGFPIDNQSIVGRERSQARFPL